MQFYTGITQSHYTQKRLRRVLRVAYYSVMFLQF